MVSAQLALQDTLYSSSNPTRRWLHNSRREWITGALRRGGKVSDALEVGPGSGIYLPVLAALAERVVALDIDSAFLDRARELAQTYTNICAATGDIADIGWANASFDLILCSEVIEHIPDSRDAIAAMARLLRPEGRLVLTTPHRWSILETVGRVALSKAMLGVTGLVYREPVVNPGHINLLTSGALRDQIHRAGLRILETYCLGLYLPGLAEFGGRYGLTVERALERMLRGTFLQQLLWTQCLVCTRAPS